MWSTQIDWGYWRPEPLTFQIITLRGISARKSHHGDTLSMIFMCWERLRQPTAKRSICLAECSTEPWSYGRFGNTMYILVSIKLPISISIPRWFTVASLKKYIMSLYADQIVSGRLHPISSALDLEGLQLSAAIPNSQLHIIQRIPHHTQTSWRVSLCNLAKLGSRSVQYIVVLLSLCWHSRYHVHPFLATRHWHFQSDFRQFCIQVTSPHLSHNKFSLSNLLVFMRSARPPPSEVHALLHRWSMLQRSPHRAVLCDLRSRFGLLGRFLW